ncbi:MAG: DUF3343 domain-containing protein [Syntrophales bacterium]|nr:DUF3343 domain-containing protein [Syntrophales bacterium]
MTGAYTVLLFPSVSHVLKAEKILKEAGLPFKLVPVPRHLSSDCGVCLRIETEYRNAILAALEGKVKWDAEGPWET